MSAETGLIDAMAAHLSALPALAGAMIGWAEPVSAAELPAAVLSLPEVRRLNAGLGERAALVTGGALPVVARIDLANPVLPAEPSFRLLSADRRTLILPHGGWVRADGSSGPFSAADLAVSVDGVALTVVDAAPAAGEVRPDAPVGTLLLGAALPGAGLVEAKYFLGQWERRLTPIAGLLRIDLRAADAAGVQALAAAVIDAFDAAESPLPRGLRKIALASISSTVPPLAAQADSRARSAIFSFEYEHEVNRPDSSGGLILRIPVVSRIDADTETFEIGEPQ